MRRAAIQTTRAMILALLAVPAVAWADEPPPPPLPPAPAPAPANSAAARDDLCDEAVSTWAKAASKRVGREITPVACPSGLVRLQVAGAGCDYEVNRTGGFQRTADGAFGVSPIANLDWQTAPEPMKKGLAAVVSALTQDPSLPIRAGSARRHSDRGVVLLGSRRNQIFAGGGVAVLAAAGLGLWWRRRKARPAAPAASP